MEAKGSVVTRVVIYNTVSLAGTFKPLMMTTSDQTSSKESSPDSTSSWRKAQKLEGCVEEWICRSVTKLDVIQDRQLLTRTRGSPLHC